MDRTLKSLACVVLLTFVYIMLQGCNESDKTSVIRKTNKIYMTIKIIVTDKDVAPLISEEHRELLIGAESRYLSAISLMEKIDFDGGETEYIAVIVECADIIIAILDEIEISEEYREEIASVRVLLNVLTVYLE